MNIDEFRQLIAQRQIEEAVRLLKASERGAACLNEAVAACVSLRDAGDSSQAFEALMHINERWPDHFGAALECLVIAILVCPDAVAVHEVMRRLPPEAAHNPHIALLLARHAQRAGAFSAAVTHLSKVPAHSVAEVPSFALLRLEVLRDLATDSVRIADELQACLAAPLGEARLLLAIRVVQELMRTQPSGDAFFTQLQQLAYVAPGAFHVDLVRLNQMLLELPLEMPPEHLAIALSFVVSSLDDGKALAMLDRLRSIPSIGGVPIFVKSLVRLADRVGSAALLAEAEAAEVAFVDMARNGLAAAHSLRPISEVQTREILGRDQTSGSRDDISVASKSLPITVGALARAPGHVLVAFFGQIRFPEYTLPKLAAYLRADFANSGMSFSFAASTWEIAGQRELGPLDGANLIFDLVPVELLPFVLGRAPVTVQDVARFLPNVCRRLLHSSASGQVVTEERLSNLIGNPVVADISNEVAFQLDIGQHFEVNFGANVALMNQGRMWHRLEGVGRLVSGRPDLDSASHVILMRPDLLMGPGSIAALLKAGMASGRKNWAITDHDPHAAYIEGLGDRYLIMDREAFGRVADGGRLIRAVFDPALDLQPYYARLGAHQFLATALFEHRTFVREAARSEVAFEIFRGRLSLAAVRDELQQDYELTTDYALRLELAKVLM